MLAEYKIKINTKDIERAQKLINETGGELQKVANDEVVVKLKYDENKAELNKIIKDLYSKSPTLAVQVEYEFNKEALAKEQDKLSKMSLTVDEKNLVRQINIISEKYSKMLSDDAPQKEIDKTTKELANLHATLETISKDYSKSYQNLSRFAKELYEDIPEMADGDSLKIITEEQYNKQVKIVNSLKKKRNELLDIGANEAEINKTKYAMEDLLSMFSKYAVAHNNNGLSGFWDEINNKIAIGDDNLKSMLQRLGLVTEDAKELKLVADGMVKSGGIIGDNNVLLATKDGNLKNRLSETIQLKTKLEEAAQSGVNVSRILGVVYDDVSDTFLELQEKAPGNILGSVYGQNENDFVNMEMLKATDQQILKLITDIAKLHEIGVGVDINPSNITYEKGKGFSLFDLDLQPASYENTADFIDDIRKGIIGAIEQYYEDINDELGLEKTNQLKNRFENLFSVITSEIGAESLDVSRINEVINKATKIGDKLGQDIVDGLRQGIDAHSDSKEGVAAAQDLVNGLTHGIQEYAPEAVQATKNMGDEIVDSLKDTISKEKIITNDIDQLLGLSEQLNRNHNGDHSQSNVFEKLEEENESLRKSILRTESELNHLNEEYSDLYRDSESKVDNINRLHQELNEQEQRLEVEQKISQELKEQNETLKQKNQELQDDAQQGWASAENSFEERLKLETKLQELEKQSSAAESILAEQNALVELRNNLDDVIQKIDAKTNAFVEEGNTVEKVVTGELDNLNKLSEFLKELRENVSKISDELKGININISLGDKSNDFVKFFSSLSKIKDDAIVTKLVTVFDALSDFAKDVNSLKINDDSIVSSINNLLSKTKELENLATVLKSSKKDIKNAGKVTTSTRNTSKYDKALEKAQQTIKDPRVTDDLKSEIANQSKQIELYLKNIQHLTDSEKNKLDGLLKKLKEVTKEAKLTDNKKANEMSISKALGQLNDMISKNTKLSFRKSELYQSMVALQQRFKQFDTSKPVKELKPLLTELAKLKAEFKELDNSTRGKGFLDTFKERLVGANAQFLTTYFSLQDWIRYGRQAVETLVELDNEILDLKKTTAMSNNELEDFYMNSSNIAKQMGATTQEIISQAAAWSRLGFNTNEAATELTKISTQFAAISPGMSTDQAQEGLVSIIKAWNIPIQDVQREVLDNVNILGNKFAESNADIVEGMKRSAAALAATGESWRSSFALFTGAQEIVQSAEVAGRALRSINLRIHGYSEESSDDALELDENLKDLKGELLDLTKTAEHPLGVSVFKEGSTTEYKDLVDYLGEIHDIWGEMSQVQQNNFLQKAFAKTQAQSGAAMIQNYDAIRRALEEMENAEGSAANEMSIVQETISYKLNALKAEWVQTAQELIDRGTVGGIIDFLTQISELLGNIATQGGLAQTTLVGLATFLGTKNNAFFELGAGGGIETAGLLKGKKYKLSDTETNFLNDVQKINREAKDSQEVLNSLISTYDGLDDSVKKYAKDFVASNEQLAAGATLGQNYANTMSTGLTTATIKAKAASFAVTALNAAISMGISMLVTAGITLLIKGIDELIITTEEATETFNSFNSSFDEMNNKARSATKSLADLAPKYNELAKGVDALGRNISLTNEEYEEYKSLINEFSQLMPNLEVRYNSHGEAIGFIGQQWRDATEGFEEYQRAQAQEKWENGITEDQSNEDALKAIRKSFYEDQWFVSNGSGTKTEVYDKSDYGRLLEFGKVDKEVEKELEAGLKTVKGLLSNYAQSTSKYWKKLNADQRNNLENFINSITFADIRNKNLGTEEGIKSFVDNIVNELSDSEGYVSERLTRLFSIDMHQAPELIKEQVDQIIKDIADYLGMDENELKIQLGVDFADEDVKKADSIKNYFTGNIQDEAMPTGDSLISGQILDKSKTLDTSKILSGDDYEKFRKENRVRTEEFENLAKAGYNCLSSIEELTEGLEKLRKAEEEVNKSSDAFNVTKPLSDLKSAFSGFEGIYNEFTQGITVSADSVEALTKSLGDVEEVDGAKEAIQAFRDVVTEFPNDIGKQQDALNTLATFYIDQSTLINNLTEDNAEYTKSELEKLGVVNADEVVMSRLIDVTKDYSSDTEALNDVVENCTNEKIKAKLAGMDLANMTSVEAQELAKEAAQAGYTSSSLNSLLMQKLNCNNVAIATSADCNALANLITWSGKAQTALRNLAAAKSGALKSTGNATADSERLKGYNYIAQREVDDALKYKDADVKYQAPKSNNTGNKSPSGSKDKQDTSKKSDFNFKEIFDWIERRIKDLTTKAERWAKVIEQATDPKRVDKYYDKVEKSYEGLAKANLKAYNKYMSEADRMNKLDTKSVVKQIKDDSGYKLTKKDMKGLRDGTLKAGDIKNKKGKSTTATKNAAKSYLNWYKSAKEYTTVDSKGNFRLKESYLEKARSGELKLEEIRNEAVAEALKNYEEWYDKSQDSLNSFMDNTETMFNTPLDAAAKKVEIFGQSIEKLNAELDNVAVDNYKYANDLINQRIKNQKKQTEANNKAQTEAQANFNTAYEATQKLGMKGVSKDGKELDMTKYTKGSKKWAAAYAYNTALKKLNEATQTAFVSQQEFIKNQREGIKQQFDNIQTYYNEVINDLERANTKIQDELDLLEAKGELYNSSRYKSQKDIESQKIATRNTELTELLEKQKELEAIGAKNTQEWYDTVQAIADIEHENLESQKRIAELNKSIVALADKAFDRMFTANERLMNNLNFVDELADRYEHFDYKTANWTEAGLNNIATINGNMKTAGANETLARNTLDNLLAHYNNGDLSFIDINGMQRDYNSSEEFYQSILQYETKWQDAIKTRYEYENKAIEVMKEKYNQERSVLQDIVNLKKESINREKDLHNYQKSIQSATTNIGSLQKQIAALRGDNSTENQNRIQSLQAQLEKAQSDLEETEYDRYLSDQQNMLDNLFKEYSDFIDEKLTHPDELLTQYNEQFGKTVGDVNWWVNDVLGVANGDLAQKLAAIIPPQQSTDANPGGTDNVDNNNGGGGETTNPTITPEQLAASPANTTILNSTNNQAEQAAELLGKTAGTEIAAVLTDSVRSTGSSVGTDKGAVVGGGVDLIGSVSSSNVLGALDSSALTTLDKVEKVFGNSKYYIKGTKKKASDYKTTINQALFEKNGKVLTDDGLKALRQAFGVSSNDKLLAKMKELHKQVGNIKNVGGFAKGGIAHFVKAQGEDGIAMVRQGEGILTPLQTDIFANQLVPRIDDIVDTGNIFKSMLPHLTTRGGVGDNITATYQFTLENCSNAQDIIRSIQNDRNVQKALQDVTVNRINNKSSRLTVNKY